MDEQLGKIKTCQTCKFYSPSFWLSVRGALCTNPLCDEEAWSYQDLVTGKTTQYERRHEECLFARIDPCGPDGEYWEAKD